MKSKALIIIFNIHLINYNETNCLRGINNPAARQPLEMEYELHFAIPAVCLRCPGTALR